MKKLLSLLLCVVWLVLGCFSETVGKDVEEMPIQSVVKDVKDNLIGFNSDNVSSIGKALNKNIQILDNLTQTINKADDYEKVFPYIVTSVEELSKSYRKIANMKDNIRKTLERRVNNIQKQRQLTNSKIEFINKKITDTKSQLNTEQVDYRKVALQTTLKFQEQERDVWKKFATGMQFSELITKLQDASGGINKFIDILDANAFVYEQASVTLKTIQSYKNSMKDLQEVLTVVDLGNDLIDSWDKLSIVIDGAMQHIETVEKINF